MLKNVNTPPVISWDDAYIYIVGRNVGLERGETQMTVLAKMPKCYYQTMNHRTIQTPAEEAKLEAERAEKSAERMHKGLLDRALTAREQLAKFGATLANPPAGDQLLYHFSWADKYFQYAAQVDIFEQAAALKRDDHSFLQWREAVKTWAMERLLECVSTSQSTSVCSNYAEQVKAVAYKELLRG
jgi:pyruvate dehydrogenase complex dehydrogenase (E1) component